MPLSNHLTVFCQNQTKRLYFAKNQPTESQEVGLILFPLGQVVTRLGIIALGTIERSLIQVKPIDTKDEAY